MYVNPRHQLTDLEALASLIGAHPLGAWVCLGGQGLIANHIPFFLDRGRGALGTLIAHVARANPVWRELDAATPCMVIFQGPQAYITPGWYPSKAVHGQVVPTWNYVVAHAHGVARVVEGADGMLNMLNRLTDTQEGTRPVPWSVADAPGPFIAKLMRAIVGIEIPIDRLQGKLKASQDEAMPDRLGTAKGLHESPCPAARAMAELVLRAAEADDAEWPL